MNKFLKELKKNALTYLMLFVLIIVVVNSIIAKKGAAWSHSFFAKITAFLPFAITLIVFAFMVVSVIYAHMQMAVDKQHKGHKLARPILIIGGLLILLGFTWKTVVLAVTGILLAIIALVLYFHPKAKPPEPQMPFGNMKKE